MRLLRFIFLLFLCLAGVGFSYAQTYNPADDILFRSGEVAEIHVSMDTADFQYLMDSENAWNENYLPCTFTFRNSLLDTTFSFPVGIRLRGNTSRTHPKRSFKFRFTAFPQGTKVFNHKIFNLKAENNDPTMAREYLSLKLFRSMNVPAARAHHTKLYINGAFMGVYLNVEQIDDEFLDTRFHHEVGNLYKCSYGASLEAWNNVYDNGVFELETFQHINDRSWLQQFIEELNSVPNAQFETWVREALNVPVFIRYLAVEAVLGHWDGYSFNQNNFYLFENVYQNRMDFIPYDLDNTFGINWIPRNWGTRDVMDWAEDSRPLTNRMLQRPSFRQQYIKEVDAFLDNYFNEDYLFSRMDTLQDLLRPHIAADTFYTKTFGFDINSFEFGYTNQVVAHAPYGLKPFVEMRNMTARSQIGGVTASLPKEEEIEWVRFYENQTNQSVIVSPQVNSISLTIYNVKGQAVEQRLLQSTTEIDTQLWSRGLYIFRFELEGETYTRKWIKVN